MKEPPSETLGKYLDGCFALAQANDAKMSALIEKIRQVKSVEDRVHEAVSSLLPLMDAQLKTLRSYYVPPYGAVGQTHAIAIRAYENELAALLILKEADDGRADLQAALSDFASRWNDGCNLLLRYIEALRRVAETLGRKLPEGGWVGESARTPVFADWLTG